MNSFQAALLILIDRPVAVGTCAQAEDEIHAVTTQTQINRKHELIKDFDGIKIDDLRKLQSVLAMSTKKGLGKSQAARERDAEVISRSLFLTSLLVAGVY